MHIRNAPTTPRVSELPKNFGKIRDAAIERLLSNSRFQRALPIFKTGSPLMAEMTF
jgi:hypothetical protein